MIIKKKKETKNNEIGVGEDLMYEWGKMSKHKEDLKTQERDEKKLEEK